MKIIDYRYRKIDKSLSLSLGCSRKTANYKSDVLISAICETLKECGMDENIGLRRQDAHQGGFLVTTTNKKAIKELEEIFSIYSLPWRNDAESS